MISRGDGLIRFTMNETGELDSAEEYYEVLDAQPYQADNSCTVVILKPMKKD